MSDSIVYINVNEGLNRVMKNKSLFSRLLVKFKDDINMNEIEAAFSEGNSEKAKNSSHTLKGLAANLALTELYKQVLELEMQIKTGNLNSDQLVLVRETYGKTIEEIDKVINSYA